MKHITKNKYWEISKDYNIDKLLYLLIDRPDEINKNCIQWLNNRNLYNRDYDLPSFVDNSGYVAWHKNDIRHRENGPAIIQSNGYMEYHVNGKYIK